MDNIGVDAGAVQPDVWPLRRGETLSNHDWFPWYVHRFLSSGLVAEAIMDGHRAQAFTAILLINEAMRQDPAGTLPADDRALAVLARCPSVEAWLAERDVALRGWVPVLVEDEREATTLRRLGHPGLVEEVVGAMVKRKRSRDAGREAGRLAVRKSRLRRKLAEMGVAQSLVTNDRAVAELAEYFDRSDLYMSADNVRAALAEVLGWTGNLAAFPRKGGADTQV